MSAPVLEIRRLGYSVHPWRIGLLHAGGRFQALAHCTFPRRRDAVPVLQALAALRLDWTVPPGAWPDAVRAQVEALVEATPGWQVHLRGLAAWEERPATPGARMP